MTGIERGSFRSMAQDLNGTGIGGALFEALIHEWYSEHGEFDDLTIDSAEDLRDYIDRAVVHSALAGDAVFAVQLGWATGVFVPCRSRSRHAVRQDRSWRSCWATITTATNGRSSLRAGSRSGSQPDATTSLRRPHLLR
ncbi:hypothetical protein [Mycobacterium servetii]|uniref:Uncharacterized protein n=1 Tax=Mycobacterium servetii TaxID=3237418 RepID=A0ABV4C8L6_9MYCO